LQFIIFTNKTISFASEGKCFHTYKGSLYLISLTY